jgi:cytochrome c oxidase subunit 3
MDTSLKTNLKLNDNSHLKLLLWLGIGGIIMLFAALTSAYVVMEGRTSWMRFDLPVTFGISTFVILLSSVSMNMALSATKKNNSKKAATALLITLVLGILFTVIQFFGWHELFANNIVFAGKESNPAGSFIYVFTGLHIAHLFGGLIALAVTMFKNSKQIYKAGDMLGMELCTSYWHFLDGLWVYLFLFLLLVR